MPKPRTLTLTGESGNKYDFEVYPFGTAFRSIGAVYSVTKRTAMNDGSGAGEHSQIYIGQTSDIKERFANHHKATCINGHNANSINIHQEENEENRLLIEGDLIEKYNPPCND